MALSDLILPKGKIVVVLSNTNYNFAAAGKALNFGIVQVVNDLCDVTEVGLVVWFDINKATPFMVISGQTYYMVDEQNIISGETAPPP